MTSNTQQQNVYKLFFIERPFCKRRVLLVGRFIKVRNVMKLVLPPVVHRVLNSLALAFLVDRVTPQRAASVLATFVQRVEVDAEGPQLLHVSAVRVRDSLAS